MTTDGVDPPPVAGEVPVIATGLHGKASVFDPQQEDWIEYSGALGHGSGEFCIFFVHAFTYLFFTDKLLNFGQ